MVKRSLYNPVTHLIYEYGCGKHTKKKQYKAHLAPQREAMMKFKLTELPPSLPLLL